VNGNPRVRLVGELIATVLVALLVAAALPAITWKAGLALGLAVGGTRFALAVVSIRNSGGSSPRGDG
jgi:hypothetical protein